MKKSDNGPASKKSSERLRELTDELRRLEAQLRAGGGPDKIERQHGQGKLTARERIDLLLDKDSYTQEIGLLVAYDQYEGGAPAAGVVTVVGSVGAIGREQAGIDGVLDRPHHAGGPCCADAGDDRSAGPIMELVIDYWPNHYMALYHAGMAEDALGEPELARKNLTAFLSYYHEHDGWTRNAQLTLARLAAEAER